MIDSFRMDVRRLERGIALAALLVASFALQAGPKEEAEAALALARARQQGAEAASAELPLDWPAARAEALKTGRAVFVRVGDLDCAALCAKLRPALITCHVPSWQGDAKPRSVLVVPSGVSCWHVESWAGVPTEEEVHAAEAAGRKMVDRIKRTPACGCPGACQCDPCQCVRPAPVRASAPPGACPR